MFNVAQLLQVYSILLPTAFWSVLGVINVENHATHCWMARITLLTYPRTFLWVPTFLPSPRHSVGIPVEDRGNLIYLAWVPIRVPGVPTGVRGDSRGNPRNTVQTVYNCLGLLRVPDIRTGVRGESYGKPQNNPWEYKCITVGYCSFLPFPRESMGIATGNNGTPCGFFV